MATNRTFKGGIKPFGKSGHFAEPRRHALQAMGIKTGNISTGVTPIPSTSIIPKKPKLALYQVPTPDGVITENDINLIKARLNRGAIKEEDFKFPEDGEGYKITPEQTQKGYDYLMNQWKTSTGAERINNPFGYREQETLTKFSEFRFIGWYDTGNAYVKRYEPIYEVGGNNDAFQYYYDNGKVNIIG